MTQSTSAEQVLSKLSPEKYRDEFSVKLNIETDNFLISLFRKQQKHGIKVVKAIYCIPDDRDRCSIARGRRLAQPVESAAQKVQG